MLQNKKTFIILGMLAAYAAYRYSKMSPTEKSTFMAKGRKFLQGYLPDDVKKALGLDERDTEHKEGAFFKAGL